MLRHKPEVTVELRISRLWDGLPVRPDEEATIAVKATEDGLDVSVNAVFHRDPPPPSPAGSTDRLWEHEVVELFLLGADERYTEVELGPHGHWLVLRLDGVRRVVEIGLPLACTAAIAGDRWTGRALVPWDVLPSPITHLNAFAIHGTGDARRYLAWSPVPGERPDFHRIHLFPALPRPLVRAGGGG